MYSVWRNHKRLGVLCHVQDISGKSNEPSGFGGLLIPDDPTLTFQTMSQTRFVFLPHTPVFQHISGTDTDDERCYMTTADGQQVAGKPLRAVPTDAPGVSPDAVLEIRSDETEVVPSNMVSVFCTDLDASAEVASALKAQNLPAGLRQMVHVSVIYAATWPPKEMLDDMRDFENAT